MTVTSVVLNFRAALAALVPVVERVGIPWRRPDAYDEWDAIASVLFEKLVVEVLRYSLTEDDQERFHIQAYDLLLSSYANMATLEVAHPSIQSGKWLFHAFGTEHEPFDLVEVRPLSADGAPLSGEIKTCSIDKAVFRLCIHSDREPIETIEISKS